MNKKAPATHFKINYLFTAIVFSEGNITGVIPFIFLQSDAMLKQQMAKPRMINA